MPNSLPSRAIAAGAHCITRGQGRSSWVCWQPKYYPFNLYSEKKALEKLDTMHKNPVTAGLVKQACDWQWSSA